MSADLRMTPIDLAHEAAFALGAVEVRPAKREVVSGQRRETLEPRIMQVLVALARQRGEMVSRDDLIQSCWGGRIVGEDSITRCISGLRRLAEQVGGFSVETVTRVGYRLKASTLPGAASALPILAVLAFDNLSDDADMAYFSDGTSEEILQTVARGASVSVVGRSSSFQFRGVNKNARHVATELNATHVLDGSVRRNGSRVRIFAQLIECVAQTTLWSDRFDGDLSDIFALQDEIAAAVAGALKVVFARTGRAEAISL
jgi:TolB-like protein